MDSGCSEKRAFSEWSMAFKKLLKDEASEIIGYKNLETKNLFDDDNKLQEHPALSLLTNYVKDL